MKVCLFSVYDSKAGVFSQPFVQANVDVAKRAFRSAAVTPGHHISDFPDDMSLIEIGVFDDATGVVSPIDHVNHGLARSYIQGE